MREPEPESLTPGDFDGIPVDLGDRVDVRVLLDAPWTLHRDLSGPELDDALVQWAAENHPLAVYPPDEMRARHERRHAVRP